MKLMPVPLWKEAPFIRYIIPFAAGILLQWAYSLSFYFLLAGGAFCVLLIAVLSINRLSTLFRLYHLFGAGIYSLLFFTGCLLVFFKDIRNNRQWIGHYLPPASCVVVSLEESLSEKTKSYKTVAAVEGIITNDSIKKASGKLILYLKKDNNARDLKQGSILLITSSLRPVENFENATGFNYRSYCALQNIYHQAFLKHGQYIVMDGNKAGNIDRGLSFLREKTLGILRTYIKGKKEAGMAEALLIGYKDDLDKELVQSYSNTGVVHVIAISGLHVGLIYTILLMLTKPLTGRSRIKWLQPVIIIIGLWMFSLLAGASPSVLRSAVMFTSIVLGNSMNRKSSIYNSLAASAFTLLCYNPMWLYDVGFQLSYIAVLSLVVFMKPIYNLIYVQNKLLDFIWQLAAVTLAAQILTTPICLFYFHQFPNLFLITNMVAVPLSSIILVGEIILCAFSFSTFLAAITGTILEYLIRWMNDFIGQMEKMPFALTRNISISNYQVIILYVCIIIAARWQEMRKKRLSRSF